MKGKKHFLVQSGVEPRLSETSDFDYRLVVGDYGTQWGRSHFERDVKYDRRQFEELFGGDIPTPVQELIEIAVATYSIDRLVIRGPTSDSDDGTEMLRSRRIKITVPVSDPRWKEIEDELSHAVSFVTRDAIEYNFRVSGESEALPDRDSDFDSISLFSGGLDSLGGSFYLRDHGYSPQFLAINHGKGIGSLIEKFEETISQDSLTVARVEQRSTTNQYTQFSRSFMYFGFAVASAIAYGVDDIFMPENGLLSRFLMLNSGWMTTRTVHPSFLRSLNIVLDSLFPHQDLSVRNPFSEMTKTDVVDLIPDRASVRNARSCPHTRDLNSEEDDEGHPMNCGKCIPCLIRIVGLMTSKHEVGIDELCIEENPLADVEFSNPQPYLDSKMKGSLSQGRHAKDFLIGTVDIMRFAHRVRNEPQEEVAEDYPELLEDSVYQLHRQFADELFATLDTFAERNPSLREYMAL